MPITKIGDVITATAPVQGKQADETGVHSAADFAICDSKDPIKQIKFDCSGLATDATATIVATGSGTFSLPFTPGTLASDADVSDKVNKSGDTMTGALTIGTGEATPDNPGADLLVIKDSDTPAFVTLKNQDCEGFMYLTTSGGNSFQFGGASGTRFQAYVDNSKTVFTADLAGTLYVGVDPGSPTVGQHDNNVPALVCQGTDGQTGNIFEVRPAGGGNAIFGVDNNGTIAAIECGDITSATDMNITVNDDLLITADGSFTISSPDVTIPYAPATSGNWSPAPSTIAAALDQLAARVKALEDA